jgi:ADP-heptose:LPS heptosyltransferase
MARSIIVIHPGALGDVLLAVQALRWAKKKFPDHRILLISQEPVGRLLTECRLIDAWMSVQGACFADLCSGSMPDSTELREWLNACDLAVAWMRDEDQDLTVALSRFGVSEMRIQSPFSPQLKARHQSDRFLETLGATTADLPADEPLQLSTCVLEQGRVSRVSMGIPTDRPLALIHPGSGSPHKCASAAVLADVIDAIGQEGLYPLVIVGPADEAVIAQLVRLVSAGYAVLRDLELSALAGVMTQASVFVGHDSGLTHLAALLGVPTIALFGPTDPEQWAPRGAHVVVLRGTPCVCRSWEAVRRCEDKPCLAISVGEILAAVRRIVGYGLKSTTPRNPSQYALSQPTSYAKVPS